MCSISNKIKFCTCGVSSPEKLRHYWILHRFNKDKRDQVIGEPVFSDDHLVMDHETNKTTLRNRLNEADAFDVPITFIIKDILEIIIQHQETPVTYCFKFSKDGWVETEYDTFGLLSHFDELTFGKIKHLIS